MKLVVVHYHFRPGGIRRVIELAVPHILRHAPRPVDAVVLASGQAPELPWLRSFESLVGSTPVQTFVEPAFHYLSEQDKPIPARAASVQGAVERLLSTCEGAETLVWMHNPGVGRNLLLVRALTTACDAQGIRFLAHHHDWWFDNRWIRWPEIRAAGGRTLPAAARIVFPTGPFIRHFAINHADARILRRHFKNQAVWLPNPAEPTRTSSASAAREARRWLGGRLPRAGAPVWLLPCRSLRRKNIAEALLLTRWLRPDGVLVVTGGPSSADERPYYEALERAARQNGWPLLLGVLAGDESAKPSVGALMAASEAVLLTSIQEGFGLPYLEAAAAGRPLIARRLSHIAPDLARFGFRFPQAYDDIRIPPSLFDWSDERRRQDRAYRIWRSSMPSSVRALMAKPQILSARRPCPISFSRLTLAGQLSVLRLDPGESWRACRALNPFLEIWRKRAIGGSLQVTDWPKKAARWLGGDAYAGTFWSAAESMIPSRTRPNPEAAQREFIRSFGDARRLHPLLWSIIP